MRNICGHNPSHLRCEGGVVRLVPDALHRANIRRSFGAILILTIWLLVTGCSTRIEYEPSQIPTSVGSLNINTATAEELEKLPHIGRKTAESIIQFRTDNGPFRRPEYLMQIRGISEKRFTELRQYIRTE